LEIGVWGLGLWVWGLGFGVGVFEFGVCGFGFGSWDFKVGVCGQTLSLISQGLGSSVYNLWFRVQGSGFNV